MQLKVNVYNHWFLRYKYFSVQWLLISWSLSKYLWCRGVPSIIGKPFLRAFQYNLYGQNRPIIHGDTSEWSLWYGYKNLAHRPSQFCIYTRCNTLRNSIEFFLTLILGFGSKSSQYCPYSRSETACPFPLTLEVFIRVQLSKSHTKKIERNPTEFPRTANQGCWSCFSI